MAEKKVALVAGASGIAGRGLLQRLGELPDWDVIALARRRPEDFAGARFLEADLLDAEACRERLGELDAVTHVFYAAYLPGANESERTALNLKMLVNLVDAVDAGSPRLERIVQLQGPKAYGCHFGPYRTPAKESDPRHLPPNFYYDQEDHLRARSGRWSWSALRPSLICGPGIDHPMNLSMVIGVYAAICKELGAAFHFPGTRSAYHTLMEATDAGHLASACVWAATHPPCAGEVFNITNGDLFRWERLWPRIAEMQEIEAGPPLPIPLTEMMADKAEVWRRIVSKHGLRNIPFERIAAWPFGEFVFRIDYDIISDTTKARRFGFVDVIETESMFREIFDHLRREKYLP